MAVAVDVEQRGRGAELVVLLGRSGDTLGVLVEDLGPGTGESRGAAVQQGDRPGVGDAADVLSSMPSATSA